MYPEGSEHARLEAFWLSRGIKDTLYLQRLVGMGATLATQVSELSLKNDPPEKLLGHPTDRLQAVFGESLLAQMLWKSPQVVQLPLQTIVSRFVSLRKELQVDVSKLVEEQPDILLRPTGEVAAEMAALASEFPHVDVGPVVLHEPRLLTAQCELTQRLKRLAELKELGRVSSSLQVFYDGTEGSDDATWFTKVFMEETRNGIVWW